MGAESVAQADDSPVAHIRKPDKVEALDVALLDTPVKETIGSPDSVLSASLQEKGGEAVSKLRVESFTFDTLNGAAIHSLSTEATTEEVDKDVAKQSSDEEVKESSTSEGDSVTPAGSSPVLIVQSPAAKESIAHEIQGMDEISLDEDGQKGLVSPRPRSPVSKVSKLAEKFSSIKQSVSASEDAEGSSKPIPSVPKKGISQPSSQPVINISKLVENFTNSKLSSAAVLEDAEGSSKSSTTVKKAPVINISKLMENFGSPKQIVPASEEAEGSSKQSAPSQKEVQRTEAVPELQTAEGSSKQSTPVQKEVQRTEVVPELKVAEGSSKQNMPVQEEVQRTEAVAELKVTEGSSKQNTPVQEEVQRTEAVAELKVAAEGNTDDASVNKTAIVVELPSIAPVVELPSVATETGPVAESQVKPEVPKAVERTEREDKLVALAANAMEALPSSKFARASEIQEASEPATPPTPERSAGGVIRLTRQMSRVSTGMGPMSPRFEIRAAKEIQDLQEKVKVMEEELRRKAAVIEAQSFNHKEREAELLNKIECLELANEQLLQGGNDSSIQLQMELTRLQRQNSVLQLRERELQFQINTQEMLKTQMLDKRSANAEPVNPVQELESKVAILESKLAEAVEVSNMYKIQLHEAFTRQKSVQSVALLNLGDGEDVLKELQKLRKQTKEQEAELLDLQDRFFITTVRLAESAAQKEELLSKLKRLQGGK